MPIKEINVKKTSGIAANLTLDADEAVSQLYRAILRRDPDAGGLRHHADRLRQGVSLESIISDFLTSNEYGRLKPASNPSVLSDPSQASVPDPRFPPDFDPPGEAGRSYTTRLASGFLARYCGGQTTLDVGFSGYDNPDRKPGVPGAIGIDLDYPGYDGLRLPFDEGSVDTIFSSHCLEHILFDHAAIRDWYRVLKVGGFIVCMVPHQALYEKRRYLPSKWNQDHKRMYTASALVRSFEEALEVNSFRVRHLAENDANFNYALGPEVHSEGAYEIEIVIEKIVVPGWKLA